MKKEVVGIRNLNVSYGKKRVLSNVDLSIPDNVRCAIIGPNGAGKSTLIKAILDLIEHDAASVKVLGKPLDEVRSRIAYVAQRSNANRDFPTTVFDTVLMGRYQHLGLFKRPGRRDREIALEAIREMRMEACLDRHISQLSGGQLQRVFIARALCQDADLYILDEPLAGVDENTETIIMDTFIDLQKKGKTIIAVHHDLSTIRHYFDYLVILNEEIKSHGPVEEVFTREQVDKAFKMEIDGREDRKEWVAREDNRLVYV
ncbi:MAG: metal ABC transporter ATP-binding protein [Spirochaetales bacterium]|nr:metal ABC transporter ATP-binding protein [Spirochaetales bacterium]